LIGGGRGPLAVWQFVLIVLAILNVVALGLIIFPPGGSVDQLDKQLATLRTQMYRHQANVQKLRGVVKKVETARADQESFMKTYFMASETTSSTILSEIDGMSKKAGLRFKEHSFSFDPVEGSDTIAMLTITANYEGNYGDLIEFVNLIDRSDRFLIIDSIQAAPQQVPNMLTARFRMNAFIRESRIRPAQPSVSQPVPSLPPQISRTSAPPGVAP
jgi:type IV pilus assembly protein PilO